MYVVSRTAFGSTVVEPRRRSIFKGFYMIAGNGMNRTHVKTGSMMLMILAVLYGRFDSWLKTAGIVQGVKDVKLWMDE